MNHRATAGKEIQVYREQGRYGRPVESSSAFVLRGLPPLVVYENIGPKSLLFTEKAYQRLRLTGTSGFMKRNQQLPEPKFWPGRKQQILREEQLLPHAPALRYYLTHFLRQLLRRSELDPDWLFRQAEALRQVAQQEWVEIPRIEAFEQITDWPPFRDLVQALIDQDLPHRFELASALILQFAEKAHRLKGKGRRGTGLRNL
ncbi:MAG: hypothetical protein RRB13_05055 [bacterium]|nr:hypothetical protein [bacterium]